MNFPPLAFPAIRLTRSLAILCSAFLAGQVAQAEESLSSAGGAPFWHHAAMGNQTGKAGMFLLDTVHGRELFVSASVRPQWGENSYWYVLAHDPVSGGYLQRHVQEPYRDEKLSQTPSMVSFFPAKAGEGAAWRVVSVLSDGRVIIYNADTRQEVVRFQQTGPVFDGLAADLDGNGTDEFLLLGAADLTARDAAGNLLWSVKLSAAAGDTLACGQMDDDAALEVVSSRGEVIDTAKRSIQWKNPVDGGWWALEVADLDGDGRDEWLAADVKNVIHTFDVEMKRVKWTLPQTRAVHSLKIEFDPVSHAPKLTAFGEGSTLRSFMLMDEATPLMISDAYPYLASRFIAGDIDSDGTEDLILGRDLGGIDWSLKIVNRTGLTQKWIAGGIAGPFLSPEVGDVTGDGVPDIVTAGWVSTPWDSQGIMVFDAATLKPIAVGPRIGHVSSRRSWFRMKLRDVNGDGRLDFLVPTTAYPLDGVEFWTMKADSTFELLKRAELPPAFPHEIIRSADVADVDGDGDLEVVTGTAMDYGMSWSESIHLRIHDLSDGSVKWTSPALPREWEGVVSLSLGDVDGDGQVEAVAVIARAQISVFDLKTGQEEASIRGEFLSATLPSQGLGFAAGTADGEVRWFMPHNGTYQQTEVWQVAEGEVKGLTAEENRSLWVVADRRSSLWRDGSGPVWVGEASQAGEISPEVGRLATEDGWELFTGLSFGIGGSYVGGGAGAEVVTVASTGFPGEQREEDGIVTLTRDGDHGKEITVKFQLSGTATLGVDYSVTGATEVEPGLWSVVIPSGVASREVKVSALPDSLKEGTETVGLQLVPAAGYLCGAESEAWLDLFDAQPLVTLIGREMNGREANAPGDAGSLKFEFVRSGNLSGKLAVSYEMGGTATVGADYRKLPGTVVFQDGQEKIELKVHALHDRRTEQEESISLRVLPSPAYGIVGDRVASGTIADGEPLVGLDRVESVPGGVRVWLKRSGGVDEFTKVRLKVIPPGKYDSHPKPNKTVPVGVNGGSFFIVSRDVEIPVSIYLWHVDSYHVEDGASTMDFVLPPKN